ncbi:hypothetical protein GCM10009674_19190 [Nesterenkonia xinjiangensis]
MPPRTCAGRENLVLFLTDAAEPRRPEDRERMTPAGLRARLNHRDNQQSILPDAGRPGNSTESEGLCHVPS